jgi:hypothetical protein
MPEETEADLEQLNEQIPAEENRANRLFFEERLAPVFAFRRASGVLDNRDMFLLSTKKAEKDEDVRTSVAGSIRITRLGNKRALVHCLVKIGSKTYENTRLFILDATGRWRLLAWANEPQ